MNIPTDRGMYIWQIPRCGSINAIADLAKASGLGHVFIKIADGRNSFGIVNGLDLPKQLADALKLRGIEPWGWQYVYNYYPEEEADRAIQRVHETGVIGFDIDGESQCKGKPAEAHRYSQRLRAGLPSHPIGLGSYRFPSVHPEFPWQEFRSICNFDMPQVYWMNTHNPGGQLSQSFNEFALMTPKLPFVPTGSAYREFGWQPTVNEIHEFKQACHDLMITSYNFWEWYDARILMPELWDAINGNEVPEPVPDKVRVNCAAMNIRSTPRYLADNSNVVGSTTRGKIWLVEDVAYDSGGKKWWQIGRGAFLAGYVSDGILLTVPV